MRQPTKSKGNRPNPAYIDMLRQAHTDALEAAWKTGFKEAVRLIEEYDLREIGEQPELEKPLKRLLQTVRDEVFTDVMLCLRNYGIPSALYKDARITKAVDRIIAVYTPPAPHLVGHTSSADNYEDERFKATIKADADRCLCGGRGCNSCEPGGRG